jgi:hypothetical protein
LVGIHDGTGLRRQLGKVAIYDRLLSQAQITAHYRTMTGISPTGSCTADCTF